MRKCLLPGWDAKTKKTFTRSYKTNKKTNKKKSRNEKGNMEKFVKPIAPEHVRALLSTLWIVVLINILSADIFSFMLGDAGETAVAVTQWMMFAFAIIHEIPIAMIILSRVLQRGINRTLNFVAAGITAVYIIAGGSATPHYIFFALAEVICLIFIVTQAKKWPKVV